MSCSSSKSFVIALFLGVAVSATTAACGDAKPVDPKTPGKGVTGATSATAAPAHTGTPLPPTPENVPNTDKASGVRIDEKIRKACGISDQEAYFAFDSDKVRGEDRVVLDKVAVCFTTGPLKGQSMRLVGHADPRGPSEYNRILGQKRADGVKTYLVSQQMDTKTIDSTTRGADDATGKDEVGWSKDRRVDVMLAE
jgi:peptidoglycan-associated lipoprotein